MQEKTTPWKESKIISVETRKGVFVLAQMLKSPYLRFYNAFRDDENWGAMNVDVFDTLFVTGVTRAFLKSSNVTTVKGAIPDNERKDNNVWIKGKSGNRKVTVWKGTAVEKELYVLGAEAGGNLVEKDIYKIGDYEHSSGLFDKLLLQDIPLDADDIIDNYELTNLAVYPLTNERLYLCYLKGRNVDPYKDLVFERPISEDYKVAIEIMSGGGDKENRDKIIASYYR